MTQLQAIRKFANTVAQQKVVIARNRLTNNWAITYSDNIPRMELPSNFNYTPDDDDFAFRADFIGRYPAAECLSDITITILHEIGHFFTRFDFDAEEDEVMRRRASNNVEYLALPAECLATDWAIAWLHDLEHWAIAKQFEADFMGK